MGYFDSLTEEELLMENIIESSLMEERMDRELQRQDSDDEI